jgi:peptidoglycan/xylan/chitin deacetylase (PgdA/CDA1 family)
MKLVQGLRRNWTIWQSRHAVGIAPGEVLLTFDDGPDPDVTGRLLDVLATMEVLAAFCVCGQSVRSAPVLARRIADEGHLIVNHGDFHRPFAVLSERSLEKEINDCDRAIQVVLERSTFRTEFFRPPCGVWTPLVKRVLAQSNKRLMPVTHFGWDTNATEHSYQNWITLTRKAAHADDGGIFVLHDRRLSVWGDFNYYSNDRGWVPQAASELITQLRSDRFVILDPKVWKERATSLSDTLPG